MSETKERRSTDRETALPERSDWDAVGGIFRSLGSPLRVGIVTLLAEHPHSVNELVHALGVSQPLVSQHLRVLRTSGLVLGERRGREMIYVVADPGVPALVASAGQRTRTMSRRPPVRAAR